MSKPRGILDRRHGTTIVTREKRAEEAIEEAETEIKTDTEIEGESGNRDGKLYGIQHTCYLASLQHRNYTLYIPHL